MTEEQGTGDLSLLQSLPRWLKEKGMQSIGVPAIAIIVSFIVTGHGSVVWTFVFVPLWKLLLTTVGTALGVGFGLGLALNVHEELLAMRERQENAAASLSAVDNNSNTNTVAGSVRLKSTSSSGAMLSSSWAGEETAYASLMTTAGYDATDHLLRGQVIKGYSKFFEKYYPFTDDPDWMKWRSVSLMKEQWPTLPETISVELGKFMEYVMRDFIASWYYFLDPGVVYEDERAKRARMKEEAEQASGAPSQLNGSLETRETSRHSSPFGSKSLKAMIFSTAIHRPAPMMSAMYQSIGIVLGNLSTRVEGVNLFSLLLIKWTKVLSQTFKTYRHLRKAAIDKQRKPTLQRTRSSLRGSQKQDEKVEDQPQWGEISEMAVAREFMLKGKLHRAMTFGMDVPSLLFADAKGEACGVGRDAAIDELTDERRPIEDKVLEQRLFGAKILYECEIDYNRVLSYRLLRALLPRAEFSSPVVRTMMTEMVAGCVLTPLMGCFCPEYLNGWIVMGCADAPADEGIETNQENRDDMQDDTNSEALVANGDSQNRLDWSERGVTSLPEDGDEPIDLLSDLRQNRMQKSVESGEEMTLSQAALIAGASSFDGTGRLTGVEMTISQTRFSKPEEKGSLFNDEDDDEGIDDLDDVKRSGSLDLLDYDADETHEANGPQQSVGTGVVEQDSEGSQLKVENSLPTGDFVLPLLAMSMIDLQRFMEFTEARESASQKHEQNVKWDDPEMQQSISQLVLVIEAALLHGRRSQKSMDEIQGRDKLDENKDNIDDSDKAIEVAIAIESFSKVLIEITNDPDDFEEKILLEEEEYMDESPEETPSPITTWQATPADLSTLRPLIAAWLHSGKAHRVMSVLINAQHSILKPFFHKHAFLRTSENADGFVRQLRQLNGVHILVDMTLALSSPNMDVNEDGNTEVPQIETRPSTHTSLPTTESVVRASIVAEVADSSVSVRLGARFSLRADRNPESVQATPPAELQTQVPTLMTLPQAYVSSTGLPRFLDFHRNENFSSSLRADRERRMQSWANATRNDSAGHQIICRLKGGSDAAIAAHRELHQVARIFYAGTNLIALRNGARRRDPDSTKSAEGSDDSSDVIPISLLTVEMACQRRRLEVPDDDSSFLLRAQPRPLNAIGVHRDQRNHDMSFKCFAATFEEPAYRPGQSKYTGGRYIRKCMLRYFPNDRTAQVVLPVDSRQLDQRKKDGIVPASIDVGSISPVPFLSGDFLKERHLCQKWTPKGATPRSGSILASSVMETSDFNSVPRSGKAIDFVYRLSLFERPMVELSGKRFTVHDSASTGPHKADGSSLEISDASISTALLTIGADWQETAEDVSSGDEDVSPCRAILRRSSVEMGIDGYPIVWMKYTRKQGDSTVTEVKSYRASYVRAALMVTSARQDAQLQCLLRCVRAGSARSATKQRTEAILQPTSKLLEYANSSEREKQSVLLRDLKLGMNNIDKAQLRRNGLLDPRYPTVIRHLMASCEGSGQVKDQHALSVPGMVPTITVYKIKCVALIALADTELNEEETEPFGSPSNASTALFREEWVIFRPMKDIQIFHKHIKTQIAPTEQSASAGARLVGAAAAAFAANSSHGSQRRRKTLLPSLNQAQKQLGVSKKAVQKRCEVLDDYLKQLLADDHPLNRCSELLMFLGAFYPFPPDVKVGGGPVTNKTDPLGRMEMKRVAIERAIDTSTSTLSEGNADARNASTSSLLLAGDTASASMRADVISEFSMAAASPSSRSLGVDASVRSPVSFRASASTDVSVRGSSNEAAEAAAAAEERKTRVKEIDMIPSIKAKIDEVPLAKVRAALFDLVRYQFDFDNANFFRNRMFSALKTMSFAVATPGEFRKMLYEAHIAHLNAESLAGWIKFISDQLFPDGVFCEFSPPTPEEELQRLAQEAKQSLPKAFPDQMRSVLGPEIVQGGLDMLHEMLQNRVVLKSMAYMLFDLLWLEVFPELHDILTGPVALETDY